MEHYETLTEGLTGVSIILFGAKYAGGLAYGALKYYGIAPICFCDNDTERQGGCYFGTEVLSSSEAFSRYPEAHVYLCMLNPTNREDVKKQLAGIGFRHILEPDDLLLLFLKMRGFFYGEAAALLSALGEAQADRLVYHNVGAFITTVCTLKCKHCNALVPYYKQQAHLDTAEVLTGIGNLLNAVDGLWSLGICGGEALLHPDFIKICEHIYDSKKVFSIRAATNAAVVAKVDYKRLAELHVALDIRDYGPLSKALPDLVAICEENGVMYDVVSDKNEWYEVKPYQSGDIQNVQSYHDCFFGANCFLLLRGAFYPCGYQGFSYLVDDGYELFDGDYVRLADSNVREQLIALKNREVLKACIKCGVNPSRTVPVAEQVPAGWRVDHAETPNG